MYIQPGSFEEIAYYTGETVLVVGFFVLAFYVGVKLYDWWKTTKFF